MNRFTSLLFAGIFLTVALSSAQTTGTAKPGNTASSNSTTASNHSLPSETTVNIFLKTMFGWNQELSWKVADIKPSEATGISQVTVILSTPKGQQPMRFYITPDQKYAFAGELMPFGSDPFADARHELKEANGPEEGPKDATVTIVEFGDLECPACKAAQPNITKLMEEEPKAKLIFENYPLETLHPWAMTGAKYLNCVVRENGDATAFKFIATVYDHQSEVTKENVDQMLKGYVKDAGSNPEEVAACAARPETEKRVHESMALGEKLDVTSTPTFFINGRRIVGFSANSVPYDAVKSMVDYDLANAPSAK